MKKVLLFLLMLTLSVSVLTSCSGLSELPTQRPEINVEPIENSKTDTSALPSSHDVTEPVRATQVPDIGFVENSDTMYLYFPKRDETMAEDKINEWEVYIEDKYNFSIDLSYPGYKENYRDIDTASIHNESGYNGFVILNSREELMDFIEKGMLQPVAGIIKDVPVFAVMDDNILRTFADRDNKVWALPLNDNLYINKERLYNGDWLNMAGMTTPETIDEFYEFAMFVADNDPDGNGKDDSYICDVTPRMILMTMADVFKAFGCYPDENSSSPIGFNPVKGKFENVVLTENFKEALSFIKNLVDEGAIKITDDAGYYNSAGKNYKLASSIWSSMDYLEMDSHGFGYYLTGLNEEKLIKQEYAGTFMAVLKDTDNAVGKVNGFLQAVDGQENFLDFYYGIEGEHYFDRGEYYEIPEIKGNQYMLNRIGIYIGLDELRHTGKSIRREGYVRPEPDPRRDAYTESLMHAREEVMSKMGSDLYYSVPLEANSPMLDDMNMAVQEATTAFISLVLRGTQDMDTALESYKTKINLTKTDEKIAALNENLMD